MKRVLYCIIFTLILISFYNVSKAASMSPIENPKDLFGKEIPPECMF